MKRYGLRDKHATLIETLMQASTKSLGASHIKDLLWNEWGKCVPTPRQIGTFLNIHPNMDRVRTTKQGAEYLWVD